MALKATLAVWNLSDSHISWNITQIFEQRVARSLCGSWASSHDCVGYPLSPRSTSAFVERAFNQSGLFDRPRRARISDNLQCRQLMLAKCNWFLMWHCMTAVWLDACILAMSLSRKYKTISSCLSLTLNVFVRFVTWHLCLCLRKRVSTSTLQIAEGSLKVIEGHWHWRHLTGHMWLNRPSWSVRSTWLLSLKKKSQFLTIFIPWTIFFFFSIFRIFHFCNQ